MKLARLLNFLYSARQALGEASIRLLNFSYIKIYLAAIFLVNALAWGAALFIAGRIDGETAILHYNVDFGANLIDRTGNLYVIPALGLVITAINLVIANALLTYKREPLAVHLLFAGALLVNLLLLSALATLYLINLR